MLHVELGCLHMPVASFKQQPQAQLDIRREFCSTWTASAALKICLQFVIGDKFATRENAGIW